MCKDKKETAIHYYFVRPIAEMFVPIVWRLGITPNAISVTRAFGALATLLYIVLSESPPIIYIYILYFTFEILDHLDGQLARRYSLGSMLGQKIETVTDWTLEFNGLWLPALTYAYSGELGKTITSLVALVVITDLLQSKQRHFLPSHGHLEQKHISSKERYSPILVIPNNKENIRSLYVNYNSWNNHLTFILISAYVYFAKINLLTPWINASIVALLLLSIIVNIAKHIKIIKETFK